MAPEALENFALPASHHITSASERERVVRAVMSELKVRAAELRADGRVEIAERLEQRTRDDMRDFAKAGYCSGLENYSRHLAGRKQGQPPLTLLDYFPPDQWNLLVDESHVSLPQLKAMHVADQRRKHSLVAHGFRLPSALDNRPLTHGEFWERVPSAVLVSATPGKASVHRAADEFRAADDASPASPKWCCGRPASRTRRSSSVLAARSSMTYRAAAARRRAASVRWSPRSPRSRPSGWRPTRTGCARLYGPDTTRLDRMRILKKLRQGELQVLVGVNLLRNSRSQPAQFHSHPRNLPSQVLVGVNLLREGLDLPRPSSPYSMQIRRVPPLRGGAAADDRPRRTPRQRHGGAVCRRRRVDARGDPRDGRATRGSPPTTRGPAPTPARSVAAENLLLNILEVVRAARAAAAAGSGASASRRWRRQAAPPRRTLVRMTCSAISNQFCVNSSLSTLNTHVDTLAFLAQLTPSEAAEDELTYRAIRHPARRPRRRSRETRRPRSSSCAGRCRRCSSR